MRDKPPVVAAEIESRAQLTPEQRLYRAILLDARALLQHGKSRQRERDWFEGLSSRGVTLDAVADVLGLDASAVRDAARRWYRDGLPGGQVRRNSVAAGRDR